MRNPGVVALIAAAWLTGGSGSALEAREDVVRDPLPQEQAAVADVVRQLFQAVSRHDLDAVEAMHLYGPKFTKFDDDGLGRLDAAEARVAERQGLSGVKSFEGRIEGLKVDVFGVVAVATFVLDWAVATDQGKAAARTRSTLVLAKDGTQWKIVHEHHSPLTATR
jgi:ketosteroid isomerase-like protein